MLRRVGVTICVWVLLGAVGACSPKNDAKPSTTPAPTSYEKSVALAANLASLGEVNGSIHGTMKVGSSSRTLSGTVTVKGHDSVIYLTESGRNQDIFDEIVVGGHRYTSRDGDIWADRGAKAAGTDLASVLASADTELDAGVAKVDGVTAHRIITAPDKKDVAPALGLDTWTFDTESTTLRVWADDAGSVLGFGTSMSWKIMLGGALVDVDTELDVMLSPATGTTIAAPKNPWQWKEDRPAGIAFAMPNKGQAVGASIQWRSDPTDKLTVKTADGYVPVDSRSVDVDSEDALWFPVGGDVTTGNGVTIPNFSSEHDVVLEVVHEKRLIRVTLIGSKNDAEELNLLGMEIFATVEFTR